jgi:tRNA 5-methylaminomethyl-2-thiouridine biosynthesis bifunctional protein
MPRLPPLPDLDWSDPQAPRSLDAGDVYFSGDGLAEKRAVFVAGCGLPGGWAGREGFTIGELGFGAGLTLLAAWEAWRAHPPGPAARLNFVSFEGFPMSAADAARIHARWPEVADLSALLVERWPVRARGVQRIALADGVSITLFIGDIAEALPQAEASVDAWFLDGFAPSKNPAMWSPETLAHVARLSAPGARAATYTVAGDVRRALEAAGFGIAKVPGVGRKRERLEAVFTASPAAVASMPAPRRILIVGAGVAGAAAAHAFLKRGAEVTVIDAADRIASGASGNAIALVMPRLDAADGPVARAGLAAWLHASAFWKGLSPDCMQIVPAHHRARGPIERQRFVRLLGDPPLDASLLAPLDPVDPGAGLLHPSAFAVRPAKALAALFAGARLRLSTTITGVDETPEGVIAQLTDGGRIEADLIVVCAGMGAARIEGVSAPPLEGRLGQLEHLADIGGDARAISDGGYLLEAFGEAVFGATFEPAPESDPQTTPVARAHNLAVLARLAPGLAASIDERSLVSRAAIRATTTDRLPFAGAPQEEAAQNKPGQNKKAPDGTSAPSRSIRLIGGLGSRGFLWAPLLAELVAAEAFGEPIPLEASARAMLEPDRFAKRAKRRT